MVRGREGTREEVEELVLEARQFIIQHVAVNILNEVTLALLRVRNVCKTHHTMHSVRQNVSDFNEFLLYIAIECIVCNVISVRNSISDRTVNSRDWSLLCRGRSRQPKPTENSR